MCLAARLLLIVAAASVLACGSDQSAQLRAAGALIVDLPGAEDAIDFDDIVYSPRLDRVIVPARRSGLYLIDPKSGRATRIGHLSEADSADEGEGLMFVADREQRTVTALDARSGRTSFVQRTRAPIDYVRYIESTRELWVTEPAAAPSGIEVFSLGTDPHTSARRAAFITVPNGPEALTLNRTGGAAYTHAGTDLVVIDVRRRTVVAQWPTGCTGTHGFPQVDDRRSLALASCNSDGTVALLSLDNGRRLGQFQAGGGEALPAFSARQQHFYARGDPGTRLVTLTASRSGLALAGEVTVPKAGHCLTADDTGHYWTCDADHGRVLRFDDP